jgi:hypothetical protein
MIISIVLATFDSNLNSSVAAMQSDVEDEEDTPFETKWLGNENLENENASTTVHIAETHRSRVS